MFLFTLLLALLIPVLLCGGLFYYRYLQFEKERKKVNSEECLSRKHVVITGASSGIGEQLVKHYCQIGRKNKIVLAARNLEKLNEVKETLLKEYSERGHDILCLKIDVSVESDCKELIEKSLSYLNDRIDTIYLNAGRSSLQPLSEAKDLEGHRSLMNTNFYGCIAPTFYLLPHLRERQNTNCHICVVSSLAGLTGVIRRTAYSASKFALHGFYESLKLELMKEGIYGKKVTLSLVCPGFVKTAIHFNALGTQESSHVKRDLSEFMSVEECVERMVTNTEGSNSQFLFIVPYTERLLIQYVRPWVPSSIIDRIVLKKGESVQIDQ
ncbi:hypothetical protein C9374_012780 [Naegleria lovaniensis]|uniref:Uncharacterized protein n=1 Tax=Naegleria lovaniensis TaxID=51637 RepID=A0AA88GCY5_NAELO|nr:uncharacterized protein C9374_012780 [Naegleria lovaniensis]KAG2373178.1 hypothetical protein C9374_012780 [Naegleria lovaniensis]